MSARPAPEPMAAINITPLIDVLLVLLIMFIMTIPAMTHTVAIDLPTSQPATPLPQQRHLLAIGPSGALTLDGGAIAASALPARLAAIADEPGGMLTLDADAGARYEAVDRVLGAVKRAGVTRLGFADNARFAGTF
ncbi:MAG: biopolymer transporter ExbD [Sphingomonas sp.]|uniref:ExbD/TolR family protein n=1 Tax=Sphingomonas sp. TaxID=28214 RepID=UPI001AD3991E|nr:biopolymer transporter ExbD [Sphingomonas sp.]MBN8808173.1 biopolymer transporter ExbD [Sphingomonas sp.]